MSTIRLQTADGNWKPFECQAIEQTGNTATLKVPALHGEWLIHKDGMTANVGGNDWRIYTLHPEDCARLCQHEVKA